MVQSNDKKMCVVRWLDNKPILMASTSVGIESEGMIKHWSKKECKYPGTLKSNVQLLFRSTTQKWAELTCVTAC